MTSGRVLRSIGATGEVVDGTWFRNCNIIEFDGVTYVFSHRAILTVVVVSKCNAACRFCSNEITFTPNGPFLEWNARLARVQEFALLCGVTKIAFTGGEPTLNPQKLYELMSHMNRGFRRCRLHTNGFGLFRDVDAEGTSGPLIEQLVRVGLTGASISVAHFDPALNRQIMVLPRSWDGMSDDALREIAALSSPTFTPRLSCVMTDEGVATEDDIFAYIEWGRGLGFRRFIFRTCSEIPDGFKKDTDFSTYNDANGRSIETISEQILTRPGVERTYSQRKSDSKVDVFTWGDVSFDVDESSEEADPDRKIRRLNVMPNGVVYTSWIDPLSALFDDDRHLAEISARRELPVLGLPGRVA